MPESRVGGWTRGDGPEIIVENEIGVGERSQKAALVGKTSRDWNNWWNGPKGIGVIVEMSLLLSI